MGQQVHRVQKKRLDKKMILHHMNSKTSVFGVFVAHFGQPKIPKCLENGLVWDKKWVKNG